MQTKDILRNKNIINLENLHEMLFLGATTKQQWHQLQQIQCHHELSVESFFLLEHNKTVQTMWT